MNNGQRITSPEGPGEVLTTFDDRVVIKLDNGETTTLPVDQINPEQGSNNVETDLTQESSVVAKAR